MPRIIEQHKYRFIAIGVVTLSLLAGLAIPHVKSPLTNLTNAVNFPPTTCPSAMGGTSYISLPSKNLEIRSINTHSLQTYKTTLTELTSANVSKFATYVQGTVGLPITFDTVSSSASAAVMCSVGGQSEWFVGGTAGLSSQGLFEIINSGLTPSNVLIYPYTPKGVLPAIAMTIKANSLTHVPLVALAPGEDSVAFNVVTLTGRVTTFLFDHRKSGLTDLGSSFVAQTDQPETTIYLGGITNGSGSGSKADSQKVRLLVPGQIDANISALVYSENGSFAPIGLSELKVAHQKVVDVALPTSEVPSPYGIVITSDQPALASVLTTSGSSGNDFAWANALTPISSDKATPTLLNFAGATPTIVFMGNQIALDLSWQLATGKRGRTTLSGQGELSWRAPGAVSAVSISLRNKVATYAGAIIGAQFATLSYLPITANVAQNGSALPVADIKTLTHHL
jgi:Family of unknown function (DUF5719)